MDNKGPNVGGAAKTGGPAGVTGSAKESVTPPFLNAKNASGAAELGAAEDSATGLNLEQNADDLDGAREDEAAAGGYYSGEGKVAIPAGEQKSFISEHKGPVSFLLGLIFLIGGMVFFGQSSQLFSFVENIRSTMNSMQTSVATRSNTLFRYQMSNGFLKNPIKGGLFTNERFKVTDKQKSKLSKSGITVVEEDGVTVMKFNDVDGKTKVVVAGEADLDTFKLKYGDDVMTFKNAFETNDAFFKAYKDGSLTWRGAIANWFETKTTNFLRSNKLSRDVLDEDSFKAKMDESDGDASKALSSVLSEGTDEIRDGGTNLNRKGYEKDENGNLVKDEDGNVLSKVDDTDDLGRVKADVEDVNISRKTMMSADGVKAKLTALGKRFGAKFASDTGSGISGKAQMITNVACIFSGFLGAVSLLVAANNTLQAAHVALGVLEAGDRTKAGDGGEATNAVLNWLNTPGTATATVLEPAQDLVSTLGSNLSQLVTKNDYDITNSDNDPDLQAVSNQLGTYLKTEDKTTYGSAMESVSMKSIWSGQKINQDDPSVKMFNFQRNFHTIAGALGVSSAAFSACAGAKILANAAGIVENGLTTLACLSSVVAPPAIVACLVKAGDLALSIGIGVAATFLIGGIIGIITPVVAQLFTKNFADMVGVNRGSLLYMGSQYIMGVTHQTNGGSLMTTEKYTNFELARQNVMDEQARYDRLTMSPFDPSSQYTFMGTLLRQFGLLGRENSIVKTINSAGSILGSSISSLTPSASAVKLMNQIYDDYDEICPDLDSIGAVGSAYCLGYDGSDMSTMDLNPYDEVVVHLANEGNLEMEDDKTLASSSDGNVVVKKDSGLADYIKYCVNRSSSFGVVDQNIVNDIQVSADTGSNTLNGVVNSVVGAIPFVGDAIDVYSNAKVMLKQAYVTGEACVAGNDDLNHGWDKNQYYQRFVEDQSLFESAGIVQKSAVAVFLEEEEKENPVDNSYEGILARYSGLTKDDVIAVLDIIDYFDYIANYDPTERYAFGQEIRPDDADELKFDNDQNVAYVVLLNSIEFADVRNRSFVV